MGSPRFQAAAGSLIPPERSALGYTRGSFPGFFFRKEPLLIPSSIVCSTPCFWPVPNCGGALIFQAVPISTCRTTVARHIALHAARSGFVREDTERHIRQKPQRCGRRSIVRKSNVCTGPLALRWLKFARGPKLRRR